MEGFRWSLLSPWDPVLVAVSGGPDSLSLLHALHEASRDRRVGDVQAAHLDHGLRGEESAREAAWVAAWCEERGIACHVERADVGALANAKKVSKQQAAREARYEFLERVAARIGATRIATGHTQDDQIETVLLNVLRGAGLDGLRGIPEKRGPFVRPLLGVSRAEIEAYCLRHRLAARRDPSNLSAEAYTRNKVRLELLPQLAREYNPAVGAALLRLSEIATRDVDYLRTQAEAALVDVTRERNPSRLVLDHAALRRLHPALLRHVLRAAITSVRGTSSGITQQHVESLAHAIERWYYQSFGLMLPAPFCKADLLPPTLTLSRGLITHPALEFSLPLPVPGVGRLPEIGWTIRAAFAETDVTPDQFLASLDADAVDYDSLIVRTWRHGDRIAPLGMGGHHKKLSDIFGSAKVPREERYQTPIVADDGGPLWLVGHTVAERARTTPATRRRLFLQADRRDLPREGLSAPAAE